MDDVRETTDNLFYTGVNFLIMAEDKKELDSVTETIKISVMDACARLKPTIISKRKL